MSFYMISCSPQKTRGSKRLTQGVKKLNCISKVQLSDMAFIVNADCEVDSIRDFLAPYSCEDDFIFIIPVDISHWASKNLSQDAKKILVDWGKELNK